MAVAEALLGKVLVHESPEGVTAGIITETEAYLQDDPASHTYRGDGQREMHRCSVLRGQAYVYLIYGIHYCFNAVCREEGGREAVLVRSLLPLEGLSLMQRRRGRNDRLSITNGPGNLCKAMGITNEHNELSLVKPPLYIVDNNITIPGKEIIATERVGGLPGGARKKNYVS